MEVLEEGKGELLGWQDPDDRREWVLKNKSREMKDKRMTAKEAVSNFIRDGNLLASGGFGHVRVSMWLVYEIMRQRKKNLAMTGKTAVHDLDVLVASGCVNKVEAAYSFGHELRGLSPASRRKVQEGKCKVVAELSNATFDWRFLAGKMGLPFIPTRVLLGTDTFRYSSAKVVKDPWSGKPICLVPACYPDVALIHVHRCDMYGNAQIDGIKVMDHELAGASKRLIISTEKIIDNEEIRKNSDRTTIPFYYVDAVVEVPHGCHPCNMPGLYYFDEEHIAEWLNLSKSDDGVKKYLDKYVYGVDSLGEYLELIGGEKKLKFLEEVENYKKPAVYPWRVVC